MNRHKEFAEWLLDKEMLLTKGSSSGVELAYLWVAHIRRTFEKQFSEELKVDESQS